MLIALFATANRQHEMSLTEFRALVQLHDKHTMYCSYIIVTQSMLMQCTTLVLMSMPAD